MYSSDHIEQDIWQKYITKIRYFDCKELGGDDRSGINIATDAEKLKMQN